MAAIFVVGWIAGVGDYFNHPTLICCHQPVTALTANTVTDFRSSAREERGFSVIHKIVRFLFITNL